MYEFKSAFLVGHSHSGVEFLANCLETLKNVRLRNTSQPFKRLNTIEDGVGNATTVVLQANYGDFTSLPDATRNELLLSLGDKRVPVIHVIRDNTLDCLLEEWIEKNTAPPSAEKALNRIQSLRAQVEQFRNAMRGSHYLELKFDQLTQSDGTLSELVVHQVCLHLATKPRTFDRQRLQSASNLQQQILKRQIRPQLVRAGLGDLVSLPRAA